MTGRQLIEWIQHHKAYDKMVVVQYRDSGGNYRGGEEVRTPVFAECTGDGIAYSDELNIEYNTQNTNAIVL